MICLQGQRAKAEEMMPQLEKKRGGGIAVVSLLMLFPLLVVLLLGGSSLLPAERAFDYEVARLEEYKLIDASAALCQKNLNSEKPDAGQLRTLDSSIRRNTAVIKKLKMISDEQKDGLMEELKSVNLSKFVSEEVSHICEVKLRSADMQAAVQICSLLHQRYRDFSPCLIQGLLKAFFPGKSGDDLDSDKNSRAMKKISTLKLVMELYFDGIVEDASTFINIIKDLTSVEHLKGCETTQTNLSLLASFARQGKHSLGLQNHVQEAHNEFFMDLHVTDDLKTFFKKDLSSYYDAADAILQSEHASLGAMESENAKILNAKGELSDDLRKNFDQLLGCVSCLVWWIAITIYIRRWVSKCLGLYILVTLALVLAASTHAQPAPDEGIPPIRTLVLNERGEEYVSFFNEMHKMLEANTEPDDEGHYFLPLEKPGAPAWWISVMVRGVIIERSALMYYRSDNIYLVGFLNVDGTLYCTSDSTNMFTNGCTSLGFKGTYHDLTGRVDRKVDLSPYMRKELLGRDAAKYAANVLVEYGVTIHDPAEAKKAILIYAIMISEALRFKPIGDQVKESWLNPAILTEEQSNMIFAWQDMSILFCRKDEKPENGPWQRGPRKLDKAKMRNLQDLSNTLDFVKGEKQCMPLRKEKSPPPPP